MSMSVTDILPYSDLPSIRERIDELFSRQMLGAVLVGKFVGDYSALLTVEALGVHIGYIGGAVVTIALFVYWDQVAAKAKQKEEEITGQKKIGDY